MSVSINGTNGLVFNDASTQSTAATGFGFKNRIINGAIVIDQRNAGASVSASGSFPVDRFFMSNAGSATAQRSTTAPAGFINSLLYTQTTGVTVGASAQARLAHHIEGLNCADLGWGTANAQSVTLSFWVRSSVTGNYAIGIINSANDRSYVASYTISSANTWEQKTITIAGDTSGTWLTDNGTGIKIRFDLGSGSNYQGTAGAWQSGEKQTFSGAASVAAVTGATFYITGVQLEKGSTATSFDYRPYGTELALCQRYYWKDAPNGAGRRLGSGGTNSSTTVTRYIAQFPVTMRTEPQAIEQTGTAADYQIIVGSTTYTCSSVPTYVTASTQNALFQFTVSSGLTAGGYSQGAITGTAGYLAWSAEL